MSVNLNELAKRIAKAETGSKEVSIGQIKEIIKLISITLYFDKEIAKDMNIEPKLIKKLISNGKRHSKGFKL